MFDLTAANQALQGAEPQQVIAWALEQAEAPLVTTNFGPYEAVILHMVTQVKADIPVVWIDSGYNTRETYLVAERLIETLKLNIEVYTPKVTAARRDAALGGIPSVEDEAHPEFTEQFKLEPFNRAMTEMKPDVWFTAVRSEQTEFRQGMELVSRGPNDVLKVAPLLHWREADMQGYLEQFELPNVVKYFDPTKALANRECGLHTKI